MRLDVAPGGEGTWAAWNDEGDDHTFRLQLAIVVNGRRIFLLFRERVRPVGPW